MEGEGTLPICEDPTLTPRYYRINSAFSVTFGTRDQNPDPKRCSKPPKGTDRSAPPFGVGERGRRRRWGTRRRRRRRVPSEGWGETEKPPWKKTGSCETQLKKTGAPESQGALIWDGHHFKRNTVSATFPDVRCCPRLQSSPATDYTWWCTNRALSLGFSCWT